MGNLRTPPLFLQRASVVRGLLSDIHTIAGAMRAIPVEPVKLVDRPRASEDPRLAKANDDSAAPHATSVVTAEKGESSRESGVDPASGEDSPAVPAIRTRKSRATGALERARAERAERDSTIAAAYLDGADVPELAERHGVSRWTVYEVLQKTGAARGKTGPRPSKAIAERNAEIAAAYAGGASVPALIERFGLTRANIYQIAENAGIDRASKIALERASRDARILEAIKQSQNAPTVAEQLGLPLHAIYRVAKLAGFTWPKRERAPRPPREPKPPREKKPCVDRARQPRPPKVTPTQPAAPLQTRLPIHPMPHVAAEPLPEPRETQPTLVAQRDPYGERAAQQRAARAAKAKGSAERAAAEARRIERRALRTAADDAAVDEFAAALARAKARREGAVGEVKRAPVQTDHARLAAAFARKASVTQSAAPVGPTEPAPSREECTKCGIPGWKGCAHWLPCDDQPARQMLEDRQEKADRRTLNFSGKRRGIAVLPI